MAVIQAETEERLPQLDEMVGESQPIVELKQIVKRVSQYDFPILIHGESGTGKELVAKAIHQYSSRAEMPFQVLNCATLTGSLTESELFGYVGGAFTGARKNGSPSLFETANRGSLFLDEVAELSCHAQAALLRVLEEREIMRVGGRRPISIDVRVITASNRSLEELVSEGEFRHDLYHRLCVIPIHVPPLRKRLQDIPLLIKTFLGRLDDARSPESEVMDYLCAYHWPGNVRELEHCVDYMVAVTDGPFTPASLPPHIRAHVDIGDDKPLLEEGGSPIEESMAAYKTRMINNLHQEHLFILKAIDNSNRRGNGIGRRALALQARRQGFSLTEGAIRSRLYFLRQKGLVQWSTGRSGMRLTPRGQSVVQELHFFLN